MSTPMIGMDFTGWLVPYGDLLEASIAHLQSLIGDQAELVQLYPERWLAIKLLEEDPLVITELKTMPGGDLLLSEAANQISVLEGQFEEDVDTIIADRRYTWINQVVREAIPQVGSAPPTVSDRLDRLVTHRWLGIPMFMLTMWVVFKLTTDIATPMLEWIDFALSGPITNWIAGLLSLLHLQETWIASLLLDGIIAGVGGVLVFVPVLMMLYASLGILEDSGYMARAAFVMDRLMQVIGLHGKSFVPLVLGFGCNVPAIYATRTLQNPNDRILTGLLVPFMSCGARLPVYVLMATIFFPRYQSLAIFAMYMIGIAVAIGIGLLLKRTVFRPQPENGMLLELPPYRLPTWRGIWLQTWIRTREFLRGAATIILLTSMVVWILMAIPAGGDGSFAQTEVEESAFARVAGVTAPLFTPLGFGTWEVTSSLMSGLVAKEVVVSTMAQVYTATSDSSPEAANFLHDLRTLVTSFFDAVIDTIKSIPLLIGIDLFEADEIHTSSDLATAIRIGFSKSSQGHAALAAFAFMLFVLLYTPCMAALAAQRQVMGTRWMWVSVFGQFALAWTVALIVFQGGLLLGLS